VCRDLGIALIAYSPLALGVLAPPPGQRKAGLRGPRASLFRRLEQGLGPLLETMASLATRHGSDLAGVALDLVPGPWWPCQSRVCAGLTRSEAVAQAGAWQLSPSERQELDQLVSSSPRMPSNPFQSR
jgi:pyridoxine 4-dehydrogenase